MAESERAKKKGQKRLRNVLSESQFLSFKFEFPVPPTGVGAMRRSRLAGQRGMKSNWDRNFSLPAGKPFANLIPYCFQRGGSFIKS